MSRFLGWTLALAALSTPLAAQDIDGFQPAAGHGDVALSFSFDSYDHFWAGTQKVEAPPLGTVDTDSITLWWRHGFTDRLAVVASLPYVDVEGDGFANLSDSGFQDLTAFLQLQVWSSGGGADRQSFVVAVGGRTAVGDYEGDAPVSLGDDTTDALVRATWLLQRSAFYLSTQVGYDLRGSDAPDSLPLAVTAGYSFGRVTPSVTYSRTWADGGTDIGDPGFTFPSNQEEYERLAAKVYARFGGGFGLSVAAFTTLDGRNTGDTTGYSLGLVWSY